MDLELSGRVALITGASKGIGKAIALNLASAGAKLCLVSRSQENLEIASNEIIKKFGITPLIITGDLADASLSKKVIDQVMQTYGRIDILVNNGEGPPPGSFQKHDDVAWKSAYERNLLAPIKFSQHVTPIMKQQKWGRIVNITSLQAREPSPDMVLSATMRAGVSAFSKAISIELAAFGITVNTVCPSAVLTERMVNLTKLAADRESKTYDEILGSAQKRIPMDRFSTPDEIADLVAFLASARAAYMTGLSINIDGGLAKGIY